MSDKVVNIKIKKDNYIGSYHIRVYLLANGLYETNATKENNLLTPSLVDRYSSLSRIFQQWKIING